VGKMFTLTRETFSALHSRRVLSEFRTSFSYHRALSRVDRSSLLRDLLLKFMQKLESVGDKIQTHPHPNPHYNREVKQPQRLPQIKL